MSVDEKPKNGNFIIVPLIANDTNIVIEFLKKFFYHDEPLNVAVGLTQDESSAKHFENYTLKLLDSGMAFKAVSSDGNLMGVILSSPTLRNNSEQNNDCDEELEDNSKFSDIVKFLYEVERGTDVFNKYPDIDRIMDIKIISVDESYRCQGVCRALINRTIELALEIKYQMVYVECSSYFSAKVAEKLGFKRIYTLYFRDYVNENGEAIFKTIPPHEASIVYVLTL